MGNPKTHEGDICNREPAAERLSSLEARIADLQRKNSVLEEQLALRDHALDATPTFFVICELSGPMPIIVYCNNAVADQHGTPRQDLVGQPVSVLARWVGGNSTYRADVDTTLRAGKTFHYEDQITRGDGTSFWVGVTIRPLHDASGRLTHSVVVGADITMKREEIRKKEELQGKLIDEMRERERVVIELQLAQKLESVGRLAAGIAHEINTPIQYVGDSMYFLRSAYEDLDKLIDDWSGVIAALPAGPTQGALQVQMAEIHQRRDIDFLRTEIPKSFARTFDGVERVTNIVKAMKEFAHPDENEQSPADLNHAIGTTLLVASNEYKYLANVRTQFADLPPVVCNISELNQVFLNLIVNAAHAIQDSGKDQTTGEIRITTALADDAVVVTIGDNGCGVPAENLSKLYDPFFTTKEVGRGTGQGLAIAHSIVVDKHGGDIGVTSTLGVGTEFELRLPIGGRRARLTV